MLEGLVEWLIDYVHQLGGIGVLIGVLLESFIAPIPSPLIPVAAGFILVPSSSTFYEALLSSFFTIALSGSFGATLGAFFGYAIGSYGGRPFVEKYGKYLGVAWKDIEKIEDKIGKGHMREAALFVSRAAPIVPLSPVSFFAGFVRFNILSFSTLTFIGCLPRYFILGIIGWWAGIAYIEFIETIGFMEDIVLFLIIAVVIGYIIYYKMRNK